MIATQNEKIFRILDFVCKKQADRLQRLLSTIHIVTKNLNNKSQDEIGRGKKLLPQEQVVSRRRKSSVFKKPK